MVSLLLLTASVALGVVETVRFASPRWPRFVLAALHRNVSLLATAFLGAHILTAIADSFAPIRIVDAFIPFVGSYRPFWLGLGTLSFDLMLALVVTSLLRERIGYPAWRVVHWTAYACWPIALLHGLGTGTDTRLGWAILINVGCLITVLAAVLVRVGWTRTATIGRRTLAATASVAVTVGVLAWMVAEPMRPGWARKAGTPSALLASGRPASPATDPSAAIPIPFTSAVNGSLHQTTTSSGGATVTINASVASIPNGRLRVVIEGTPSAGGGVVMSRGRVRLGVTGAPDIYRGGITSLNGTHVVATLHTANGATISATIDFAIDASNAVAGTMSARA
jgi:sulfoxide reductase heme-binding subunit YedZ